MKGYLFVVILGILLSGCREQSTDLKITSNGDWTLVKGNIHIFTSASVNSVLISSGKRAVLINPGSGRDTFEKIELYCQDNDIVLTDLMITNTDPEYSANISYYRDSGLVYHTARSLQNQDEIMLGDLKFSLIHLYDYRYRSTMALVYGRDILISGGIIEPHLPDRRSIEKNEIDSLNLLKNQNYKLIIPGSGFLLKGASIDEYIERRLGSVKYYINTENPQYTKINDNIFVFTGSEIVAREFHTTIITSGNEAVIIDTGTGPPILLAMQNFIKEKNLILKHIFITHDHFDHGGNVQAFIGEGVQVHQWQNSYDGEVVSMDDQNFRILYTSGHYGRGKHISIELNNDVLISGDILVANVRDVSVIASDPIDLKESLERVKSHSYSLIIPGHKGLLLDDRLIDLYLSQL